jgi:hypothetical protein
MEERVEEFRDEVSVCLQVKMGKIGDDVLAIRENLNLVLRKFDGKFLLMVQTHIRNLD